MFHPHAQSPRAERITHLRRLLNGERRGVPVAVFPSKCFVLTTAKAVEGEQIDLMRSV